MDAKELIETGLTKNQADVYLEVINHPGQSGGEIAKRVPIDRSFVYGILNSLVDKGLVSHIVKGKVKLFYATDPENLLKEIEERRNKIGKIVKNLKLIKEKKKPEITVEVYEGKAGLKAYIRDLLKSGSFLSLGGGGGLKILDVLKYDYPHYLKELEKKKIKGRTITSPQNKKTMKKLYKKSKVKIETFEGLKSEVSFTIFKDKLAIYSVEEKPFVIVINEKSVSDALRDYFNKLWEIAEK